MTTELITNIIGYTAAICMVCGYLPQAVYTIRTAIVFIIKIHNDYLSHRRKQK